MTVSRQIIAADDLLRRIRGAPFSGPLLDLAADRTVQVIGVTEDQIDSAIVELRRVLPEDQPILAVPAKDGLFDLTVDPVSESENWRSAQRLHAIIGYLRSPNGCPWDRAQDWNSLAPDLAEEAYEVIDAIAAGDPLELAGELGDLLLVIALLTQIAEERGAFTIEDVYELVNRKLIRRHPHVFGDDAADTPDAVLKTWQRIKQEERGATAKPRSKYDRLPKSMPAIAKAAEMLDREAPPPDSTALPATGDDLLALIEAMYIAGRDPEAELQVALDAKYRTN